MRWTRSALAVALVTAVSACAQQAAPASAPSPALTVDTLVLVDTVRIESPPAVSPDLEDRVARLQIQVLERDVQLRELQEQLDATRLELVRNMARLQMQATRAEAASGMAEAEIAIATLQRSPGGEALPELARAQALFAQSSSEFAGENYGGALYLATQVRTTVRGGQLRLVAGGGAARRADESLFAVPVPLQTTTRSNVRSGPGLDFDVRFTLEASALITGQSHTSQWVRIVDDDGREGWIFHDLVTDR